MPRTARIVIPNWPHHVVQRGNNRQDVFFLDDDRHAYLELLRDRCAAGGVSILAYCLMTNHVHLVAVPPDEEALAQAIGRTHFLYTRYINRLHERSGHLWQNRFFSCALDESHLWTAARYVERNPVRARIVRLPWRYRWSSAAVHTGHSKDRVGLLDLETWSREWTPRRWERALQDEEHEAADHALLRNTHTGRPLASDSRLSKLERRLGRRVRPLAVGRPKKAQKTARGRTKASKK